MLNEQPWAIALSIHEVVEYILKQNKTAIPIIFSDTLSSLKRIKNTTNTFGVINLF